MLWNNLDTLVSTISCVDIPPTLKIFLKNIIVPLMASSEVSSNKNIFIMLRFWFNTQHRSMRSLRAKYILDFINRFRWQTHILDQNPESTWLLRIKYEIPLATWWRQVIQHAAWRLWELSAFTPRRPILITLRLMSMSVLYLLSPYKSTQWNFGL